MRTGWLAIVVALAACGHADEDAPEPRSKERPLDVAAFEAKLRAHDVNAIETVRVEPVRDGVARYVVTWRATGIRDAAEAPFPGALLGELIAAPVTYVVHGRARPRSAPPLGRVKEIDANTFHHSLRQGWISRVEIFPYGDGSARYLLTTSGGPIVVFAEYSRDLLDDLRAAGIAYTVDD